MPQIGQNGKPRIEATDLPTLAHRINTEYAAGNKASKKAIEHYVAAGRALVLAKVKVGHGNWEAWVEEHLECSVRQARRYMALAEHVDEAKTDVTADLTKEQQEEQLNAQWRIISGNAATDDQPASEPTQPNNREQPGEVNVSSSEQASATGAKVTRREQQPQQQPELKLTSADDEEPELSKVVMNFTSEELTNFNDDITWATDNCGFKSENRYPETIVLAALRFFRDHYLSSDAGEVSA